MEDNFQYLSKNVKNYIKKYCRTYCKTLVESYRDIIAERMDYAIEKYYASYDPIYYKKRSGKMKKGVYKKYTKTAGRPIDPKTGEETYKGGIILYSDSRYYQGAYPVRGATMSDIYEWSVMQGNHGRELVGISHKDSKDVLYMATDNKKINNRWNSGFGTGRRNIWDDVSSHYIYGNHKVGSNPNGNPFSPYKYTLKYNIQAFDKAHQIAINKANSILKPGLFW